MKYASVEDLKTWLKITASQDEATMDLVLDMVTAAMEDYTGVEFLKAARTKTFYPDSTFFYVNSFPIDTTANYELKDDGIVIPQENYVITPERGRVALKYGEFKWCQYPSVTFTWTGGYQESGTGNKKRVQVPDSLKRACLMQAAYEFKNKDNLGLGAVAIGGGSIQLAPPKLLTQVTDILDGVRGSIFV